MFDIGFFEILLVSVVALLVLGPEKLPGAVRTAGLWIGRLKRSFNNIKTDIEKEIGADEIRRQLRNEAVMEKFDKTKNQFTKTIDSVKAQTDAVKKELDLTDQFSSVAGLKPGETKSPKSPLEEKATETPEENKIENSSAPEPAPNKVDAIPDQPSESATEIDSEPKPSEKK